MTPNDRAAMCDGKLAYPTMRRAKWAAKMLRWKVGDIVAPYRCPACRKIHIGEPKR